jgi:TPR repeat protein
MLYAVSCLLAIPPFGYAQSITELKNKAEDGDVQAQLALAKAYDLGEGVPKDEEKAVQWWEKAAEHAEHGNAWISAGQPWRGLLSQGTGCSKR